jgi:hypothetical protein
MDDRVGNTQAADLMPMLVAPLAANLHQPELREVSPKLGEDLEQDVDAFPRDAATDME